MVKIKQFLVVISTVVKIKQFLVELIAVIEIGFGGDHQGG